MSKAVTPEFTRMVRVTPLKDTFSVSAHSSPQAAQTKAAMIYQSSL
jgi:hypothetical protein